MKSAGHDEQRHRERDLRRDEPVRKRAAARPPPVICPAPARIVLMRSGRVLCSAGKRPNSRPVAMLSSRREDRHRPADPELDHLRRVRLEQHADGAQRPLRHDERRDAAERGEEQALGEELHHEVAARGAEREPHAISVARARAAREQQVGDVGAGDQQHDAGDARTAAGAASSASRWMELWPRAPSSSEHLLGAELRHRLRAHALLERRLDVVDDAVVHAVDACAAASRVTPGLSRANR